jgi:hypothetical protein
MPNQGLVYVSMAIYGDRSALPTMKYCVETIKQLGFIVVDEHVVADNPREALAKKLNMRPEAITDEDIERFDFAWLTQAEFVIAEVSFPSIGGGREIEYGRVKGEIGCPPARVLCLYNAAQTVTPMILGMTPDRYPSVMVRSYSSLAEAEKIVQDFLLTS